MTHPTVSARRGASLRATPDNTGHCLVSVTARYSRIASPPAAIMQQLSVYLRRTAPKSVVGAPDHRPIDVEHEAAMRGRSAYQLRQRIDRCRTGSDTSNL